MYNTYVAIGKYIRMTYDMYGTLYNLYTTNTLLQSTALSHEKPMKRKMKNEK